MLSSLLKCFGFAISLLGFVLSLWLITVCHTAEGRIFGIAGLLLAVTILLGCIAFGRGAKAWNRSVTGVFVGFIAFSIVLLARAPDGRTAGRARVQNRYVGGSWNFRRFAFGNLLPEIDQFRLGFQLVPAVDSLFTGRQARHLAGLTTAIYDELESDADFRALGSVMPEAYDELWGQNFAHGHYFLYIPTGLDRVTPNPAIVFLHGSGGNFKAYTWLLAKVADKLGCVVIAPSFGLGTWHEPETSKTVTAAMNDAERLVKLDKRRLHLIGLSNGGLGTSQCDAALGKEFQTLIFLSPVFDESAIAAPGFAMRWKEREILIITGKEDDRVPFDYVTETAQLLSGMGIRVMMHPVDRADHFMLFSHEADVLDQIESWLRGHGIKP
ncbi:MAG: Dipeptidyl aminopeptidase/acylaminoacyl-peptidase-like protein [Chthoniobacteraceae bacterium]|nr:Dipeptidyl aminopeptidase/acylaminoacyl-peptidase-like protein [Chthoniobacteraceae bacterium]